MEQKRCQQRRRRRRWWWQQKKEFHGDHRSRHTNHHREVRK
jgi:hypothetical protein